MADEIIPGFEIDPAKPHLGGHLEFKGDSPELCELERRYPGVRISSVEVWSQSVFALTYDRTRGNNDDLVEVYLSASGAFEDLVRHRFAHATWDNLPKCGIRSHRTDGFGRSKVHARKDGRFLVSYARLDHALDLIAPALLPMHMMNLA